MLHHPANEQYLRHSAGMAAKEKKLNSHITVCNQSPVHEGQSLFLGKLPKPTGYQPGSAVILYLYAKERPLLFTNGDVPPPLLYDSPLSRIVLVGPEGRGFCIADTGYNLTF